MQSFEIVYVWHRATNRNDVQVQTKKLKKRKKKHRKEFWRASNIVFVCAEHKREKALFAFCLVHTSHRLSKWKIRTAIGLWVPEGRWLSTVYFCVFCWWADCRWKRERQIYVICERIWATISMSCVVKSSARNRFGSFCFHRGLGLLRMQRFSGYRSSNTVTIMDSTLIHP